jgi:histidinol dehydrogenase
VIRRIDLRGRRAAGEALDYRALVPRASMNVESVLPAVAAICAEVRERGLAALRELTARFDGIDQPDLQVPARAMSSALASLDPTVRAALEESIDRVRRVHADQRRAEVTTAVVDGGRVTQRWLPVQRVGLYVPGGLAVLPSSMVMNAVPAQIAGVESLAVASPPQHDHNGRPHPAVLAACALLGVDEVYAVGGAQAVAMFAYGVRDSSGRLVCRPVDTVTGPGNVYVTAAKRLLGSVVGIDAEAGPTEILVLADQTADPGHVAADLISQAEHGPHSASILVTESESLADAVQNELEEQVAATKHADRVRAALSGRQSAAVLVDDVDQGLQVVDGYAAEHVEVQTADATAVAARVRNAGAIFIGSWAPVSLGDYCAGSNHVLPTGGCARHSGGLSVQSFLRGIHVVEYDRTALEEAANHVSALAAAEDLPAHAAAVNARFRARFR